MTKNQFSPKNVLFFILLDKKHILVIDSSSRAFEWYLIECLIISLLF